ncbi:hypothetical protein LTR56_013966 [Elasticomyces elasticus]|nr:hypothetical protein LTR56_013966 [Elasticomyces elasticus]KAK3656712.1 hypothetical protein LTR22_009691 [Elasticomyces elasticus]KAK4921584.1 hypothetical protein LTR49_011054 [Elasticomyces elasticus]KAK5760272.1 hypothetical protein LTS12_009656 [Elasticomyces elasticus]
MAKSVSAYTKELFLSGSHSDLTIHCGGQDFRVHKYPLLTQSPWFRTALSGAWAKGTPVGTVATLTIEEDDPEILKALLKYFYIPTYDDSTRGTLSPATFAVKIYAIADKYDAKALCDMAASKLSKSLDPMNDVEGFVAAIEAIDELTGSETLWDIVVPKIVANRKMLARKKQFTDLLHEMPELLIRMMEGDENEVAQTVPTSNGGYDSYGGGGRTLG